jgi:hypothetical protein
MSAPAMTIEHSMIGKAIEAAPPGTLTVRLRLSQ